MHDTETLRAGGTWEACPLGRVWKVPTENEPIVLVLNVRKHRAEEQKPALR